jgi:hypothetical protein
VPTPSRPPRRSPTASHPWLVATLFAGTLPAQFLGPLSTQSDDRDAPLSPAAATALDAARRGLASDDQGALQVARAQLVQALPRHPRSPDLLAALVEIAARRGDEDRDDAVRMWLHRFAEAAHDARGKLAVPRSLRGLVPEPVPGSVGDAEFAKQRVAALRDLTTSARRLERAGREPRDLAAAILEAHGIAEIGWILVRRNGALLAAEAEDLWPRFEAPADDVLEALRRLMGAPAREDLALRAAYLLRGIARQAAYEDLRGPKPTARAEREGRAAEEFLERVRAENRAAFGPPKTVDELLAMSPAERDAFSARWSDPSSPAYAITPEGRYVVETALGHEVLLAATAQLDFHHKRLVGFYDRGDPFTRESAGGGEEDGGDASPAIREGLVRIVADRAGLESEGAPYWWAGGFQSGDVTTVSFACSTDEALGRTLTHELTHRFDGVLFPFQPAWLAEGRATWTGSSYTHIGAEEFVLDHLPVDSLRAARDKGYGRAERLRPLLDGEPPDYRDNYPVGASLYTFLRTWHVDGEPVFAAAFDRFTRGARGGRGLGWFEACFCDGKQGRPSDLAAFAEQFAEFLQGPFVEDERERPAWLERYTLGVPQASGSTVLEPRTWITTRARTEPWFGQDHASDAFELLAEAGDLEGAAIAGAWMLLVDEWTPRRLTRLADVLGRLGRSGAAGGRWFAQRLAAASPPADEATYPGIDDLPALKRLIETLGASAAAHLGAGLPRTAGLLAARQRHLARTLGLPAVPPPALAEADREAVREAAIDRWLLGTTGTPTEPDLLGFEDRRVQGLWYRDETTGDLHVGRSEASATTGIERNAPARDAFVLDAPWVFAGRYRLRTRVHFTTSAVDLAVVIGHTRRERDILVEIGAGQLSYARGDARVDAAWDGVSVGVDGRFPRDEKLAGSAPSTYHSFGAPRTSFDLELVVVGPTLHVLVDGEYLFGYVTPTGLPIEGRVGFATSRGAARLQQPRIERLDEGPLPEDVAALAGLALDDDGDEPLEEFVARLVSGVPSVPDAGALLLVIPPLDTPENSTILARRAIEALAEALAADPRHPPVVLALPDSIPATDFDEFAKIGTDALRGRLAVRHHARRSMPDETPVLILLDAQGAVRLSLGFLPSVAGDLSPTLQAWMRVLHRPGV